MLTIRQASPQRIVRDQAQTVSIDIYKDGAQIAPDADGVYTLYSSTGNEMVTKVATAGTPSTVSYLSSDLADKDYSACLLEEWVFEIDGQEEIIKRDAMLVRSRLYPVVTYADLLAVHSDLGLLLPDTEDEADPYADKIEEAWKQLIGRLVGLESFPQLILNAWALRGTHLYRTMELIAQDFSTNEAGEGKWTRLATTYGVKADDAFGKIKLKLDPSETRQPEAARSSVVPVVMLKQGPRGY